MGRVLVVAVVGVGTVSLVALSWRSLGNVRSHGFFRFLAFETILCLVVLNAPHWFDRPMAPMQLVSWTLLASSLLLAIHGFHLLRVTGKPASPPSNSALYRIENTTVLVTVGAYRYVRHPLYASALLGTSGAVLKAPSPVALVLGVVAAGLLLATAKAEESEDIIRFGKAYREYMARTRVFIPFVF